MGQYLPPAPVLRLTAAFSRSTEGLAWARTQCEAAWGPVAVASPAFDFAETEYYRASMGLDLKKCFWAFEALADAGDLAAWKRQANTWEATYAAQHAGPEPRPINLDPGYLTLGKLVLASTKDHAHRIYLGQAIFAEVTLFYRRGRWESHEFTFPDYRRADYHAFFDECRAYLRRRLAARSGT